MARKPATPALERAAKPPKAKVAAKAKAPAKALTKPRTKADAAANAIDVSGHGLTDDFLEIMRLWVEPGGAMNAFIRPRLKDPELFGRMLAQAARQGSRAYAQDKGLEEGEALRRIWAGIDETRALQNEDQGKNG
jgi:hypothetical protein